MAQLATLARPYAQALFQVARHFDDGHLSSVSQQLKTLATVSQDPELRQWASHPQVSAQQIAEVMLASLQPPVLEPIQNLLRVLIDNDRWCALHEVEQQFHTLLNAQHRVFDAHISSAFALEPTQLPALIAALEKRFARRLHPIVTVEPALIGGIRVVVGDEVLDTSVQARLQQMSAALTQ